MNTYNESIVYQYEPEPMFIEESELNQPFLTDNEICLKEAEQVPVPDYNEAVHNEKILLDEQRKKEWLRLSIREDHLKFNPHFIKRNVHNRAAGRERANCIDELIGFVLANPLQENPEAAALKENIDRVRAIRKLAFFKPERVALRGYTYNINDDEHERLKWSRKLGPDDVSIFETLVNRIISAPLAVNPEAETEDKGLNKKRVKTFAGKKVVSKPLLKEQDRSNLLYSFGLTEDGNVDIDKLMPNSDDHS